MKKRLLILCGGIFGAVLLFCGGLKVGAASGQAGSVSDPLITQSYLEQRLKSFSSETAFTKVTLAKGKTILASEGAQFFLYSGSGTVSGAGGLTDLTTGELFTDGNSMVKYHLFSSSSGKNGMKASSETILFLQGAYSIN